MDFESWWLIFLPLLFALGWMAARFDFRHILSETRHLPDSYFKGLNFLLNEQPDRAIDAFVEVAKLDPETVDLHFALGNLFRRRGETERAIRVHQSLLLRADLPDTKREHALHELAQDYLKAGMLDRAEAAYLELESTAYSVQAKRALVRIYESERDWLRAIEAVKQLGKQVDDLVPQRVHYSCEIAQKALEAKSPDLVVARQAIQEAQEVVDNDPSASTQASRARLLMLRASLAALEGDDEAQRQHLLAVLDQAPEYVGLMAEQLVTVDTRLKGQAIETLSRHYQLHPSLDLFQVIFKALRTQQNSETAWLFARDGLRAHPSLLGLDSLIEVELAQADRVAPEPDHSIDDRALNKDDLVLLRSVMKQHSQRLDRYTCHVCGFQAKRYYWQCPGCHGWETYRPRRLEESQ
ncbi:MAG: lipopolysaccharide assembly protein LapB [Burkholderiaceae bacterium]|nr:lipopolysaccharide assembly protein LapB [Burkholderiaceae bacterium]